MNVAKIKAKELINKMNEFAHTDDYDYEYKGAKDDNFNAIKCALILVDEIIAFENKIIMQLQKIVEDRNGEFTVQDRLWPEVKNELNRML
jgi:thymidine kinase